jgi:hypothetical protein
MQAPTGRDGVQASTTAASRSACQVPVAHRQVDLAAVGDPRRHRVGQPVPRAQPEADAERDGVADLGADEQGIRGVGVREYLLVERGVGEPEADAEGHTVGRLEAAADRGADHPEHRRQVVLVAEGGGDVAVVEATAAGHGEAGAQRDRPADRPARHGGVGQESGLVVDAGRRVETVVVLDAEVACASRVQLDVKAAQLARGVGHRPWLALPSLYTA